MKKNHAQHGLSLLQMMLLLAVAGVVGAWAMGLLEQWLKTQA